MNRTDSKWKEGEKEKDDCTGDSGWKSLTKIRFLTDPVLLLATIRTFTEINYFELNKDFSLNSLLCCHFNSTDFIAHCNKIKLKTACYCSLAVVEVGH